MRPIDAEKVCKEIDRFKGYLDEDMIYRLKIAVKRLPTVEPERQHGKWIRNDNGTYSCSECHSWIPNEQHYYARYCLFCGAKMEKENADDSD